ncbi:MAG: NAD(P)H-hydrate dehydratase [Gemmobacter sp.]
MPTDPTHPDLDALRGRLAKRSEGFKYTYGHALILAGGPGQGGAARLAARGALRIGAGLVTLGCPLPALAENSARMDTVMLRAVHDGAALARVLDDPRYNALCLGPGIGFERARELVPVALGSGRGAVVDADALSAYATDPDALFALCTPQTVLTPHGGEFARLFPDLSPKLPGSPNKAEAARRAAVRAGAVVLYKGPETVIAAPDGRLSVSDARGARAAPWLATAGSGDVLAGFITGLLARGFDAMEAAETATYLHVEAARAFGPGLIAEDIPEQLPAVFRALGL